MTRIVLPQRRAQLVDPGGLMSRTWFTWLRTTFLGVQERLVPTETKIAAYTATAWDAVMVDPTAGGFTVTLPTAPPDASEVLVKNVSSSVTTVVISRGGDSDTIDGATTVNMTSGWETLHLLYSAQAQAWRNIT